MIFTIRPLPSELQKLAIKELNEEPDRILHDIKYFRDWINTQAHLNARTDDQFLLAILRGCKFSMEKAKLKIDRFYTLKTKYPDMFAIQNIDDPRVYEFVKLDLGLTLPVPLNGNGPRIQYINWGLYPTDKFHLTDLLALYSVSAELLMREDDYAAVNGYIQICDVSLLTPAHALQATPLLMKKCATFAVDALPLRLRAIHIVNNSLIYERLLNMIKPFLNQKYHEKIFVHSSLETLHNHVPVKYLPKELGGENGCREELHHQQYNLLLKYRDYIKDDVNYRNNEKLRVGVHRDYDQVFGLDGTFRKLNVD